ncbi:ArsR family transcriptional regulator [Acidianus sulfidivorans JP7]|uniref:Transcriptional regulator n=1 Tax=Acidianus sulfidivorans JP7 TaxID=619593 RepID=A0A2U9IN11_9CREN|nr:winged helix-turn-helix domain-containing protein [Acidianus sulfidivorans]AWR97324.1 ArsR family transcriptional regulator [Acidianus sulfidivorans JP7]
MDLIISDPEDILKISSAFSSMTRINILKIVSTTPKSITELSNELMMTKGNISSQVSELEHAGLIEIKYENGEKGIKKIIKGKYDKIIILLSSEDSATGSLQKSYE